MSAFVDLKVLDIRKETKDCVSVAFFIPEDLKSKFEFKAGQYITLKFEIAGEEYRRSYSICSAPSDEEFRVAVKKVSGGVVSTFINEKINAGDTIAVMPPMGTFIIEPNENATNDYVFIAAGSGITPILSQIKTLIYNEPKSKMYLIYGNRSVEEVIFLKELEELKANFGHRFQLDIVYSGVKESGGFLSKLFGKKETTNGNLVGRINASKVRALLRLNTIISQDSAHYFLCGPSGVITESKNALKSINIKPENVHIEHFTSPDQAKRPQNVDFGNLKQDEALVTVILNNEEHLIKVKPGQTILDAALKAKLEAPYSCKSAVCSTCMAKKLSGDIDMDQNYVLSEHQLNEGFVLCCQARPKSDNTKITWDIY